MMEFTTQTKASGVRVQYIRQEDADSGIPVDPHIGIQADRAEDVLYVTDSGQVYRELVQQGLPAVGYLHDGNRGEEFPGAMYVVENPKEVDEDSWVKIYERLTGKPWTIAATRRLILREMTPEDLDALYVLYADSDTRRFLTPPQADRASEAEILKAYIEKIYGFYGYGMWAVCERETGEMIGRVGFSPYQGESQAVELGYLIRADRRRQGLAAEAVAAALRFAGEEIGFTEVCARTSAENVASIALLRKMGFEQKEDPALRTPPERGISGSEVDDAGGGGILYFEKHNCSAR